MDNIRATLELNEQTKELEVVMHYDKEKLSIQGIETIRDALGGLIGYYNSQLLPIRNALQAAENLERNRLKIIGADPQKPEWEMRPIRTKDDEEFLDSLLNPKNHFDVPTTLLPFDVHPN